MDDVGETVVAQRVGNEFYTGSVNRSVDNLQVGMTLDHFRIKRQALDCCKELLVHSVADNLDKVFVTLEFDFGNTLDTVYIVDDIHIVRSDNLCAVAPICLVAVILFGVVRRCDIHTALATELADSERQFGSRTEGVEKIYLDTVGRENIGYNLSKLT